MTQQRSKHREKGKEVDWYYAVGGQQFGPYDQKAFDYLVAQGQVTGITLVWHEGLTDWVQHQTLIAPPPFNPDGPIVSYVQCSQCYRQGSSDDMVQYQGHWVCAECKSTFYQRVREGGVVIPESGQDGPLRFAGFWIRVGSGILDSLILLVLFSVIGMITAFLQASSRMDLETVMFMQFALLILQVTIFLAYVTVFLGKFGATPGKMACGLKVRTSDGQPITMARAFGRGWAVILSSFISYVVILIIIFVAALLFGATAGPSSRDSIVGLVVIAGFLGSLVSLFPFYMAGMTKQKCALHDFVCNTRVVHAR